MRPRQPLLASGAHRLLERARVGAGNGLHADHNRLAPEFMGHADDGDILQSGKSGQRVLEGHGRDIDAAANDEVLDPPGDAQPALGQFAHIAGRHMPVIEIGRDLASLGDVTPIGEGRAHDQLGLAFPIEPLTQSELGKRHADIDGLLGIVAALGRDQQKLAGAVAFLQRYAEGLMERLAHADMKRRGAAEHGLESGRALARGLGIAADAAKRRGHRW